MSRIALTFSVLTALTSFAAADRISVSSESQQVARRPVMDLPIAEPAMRFAPPVIDRDALRAALLENRAANLARFHDYQLAGVFPSNVFKPGALNVWLDQDGHYCAAATIIRASGEVALVEKVASDNNFIKLSTVKDGPLMDWILTSGLTKNEIVAIQRPMRPVTKRPVAEPTRPIVVDAKLRKAETARLARLYKQIQANITKNEGTSIELAVDRLMRKPQLAWRLLHGSSAHRR